MPAFSLTFLATGNWVHNWHDTGVALLAFPQDFGVYCITFLHRSAETC